MSPLNKTYRQRGSSFEIQKAILNIFLDLEPRLTVRQIFYSLTVKGIIAKTEEGYRQTVYQLKNMRETGSLPYGWIADNTRWYIKPDSKPDLFSAMNRMQELYRRDLWAAQPEYVEIWVEKDALAGVISPITAEYDVPLYVSRGYGSITILYDAAMQIKSIGKPSFVYHFGDFDPSGVDASFKIRDGLRKHGANIHFERVAITEEHILDFNLPTRPTKPQDPRTKKWGDKPSVELDALPAPILRSLVKRMILKHIDQEAWEAEQTVERLERKTLYQFINYLVLDQNSGSYNQGNQ